MITLGVSARADVNISLGLMQAIAKEEDPAFAPMSVVDVMSLFYYGADGQTRNQLAALVGGASQKDVVEAAAKDQRKKTGYARLGSIWFDDRVQVTTDFYKAASDQWDMQVSAAPLREDLATSVDRINFWYDQQTNGYFKNVVSTDMLSGNPDMIAVMVTAFKLPWEKEYFEAAQTKPQTFYHSADNKFPVLMMHAEDKFNYAEDEYFQILRIPYKGGDFNLLLFLPRDARNFDQAMSALNGKYLTDNVGKLKSTLVNVTLPRVAYTTELDWREVFLKSKLSGAFTAGQANFSRINGNNPEPLYIAKFIETVEIAWGEEGTEAKSGIAMNAVTFGAKGEDKKPKAVEFLANHPFAFLIYDEKAKDVAFAGIINAKSQMVAK